MSITTTLYNSWTVENTTGVTGYKVNYRLSGTTLFTQIGTSGTTIAIPGLQVNRLYDLQVTTINNLNNPVSALSQAINITDPGPVFSPVNVAVSYIFSNLSSDMTSYTATIATTEDPGAILATHVLSPTSTITDTFTGLTALTDYVITLTPAAGIFYKAFTYSITTTASANCPAPQNVNAILV